MARLAAAARSTRVGTTNKAVVETLLVEDGQHSWLYEDPLYRRAVAGFLARALGGPFDPATAAELAGATAAVRIPEAEAGFAAVEEHPNGYRTLAELALPGVTRPPRFDADEAGLPAPATEP